MNNNQFEDTFEKIICHSSNKKTQRAWEKHNHNCETLFEQTVKGFLKNIKTDFRNRKIVSSLIG